MATGPGFVSATNSFIPNWESSGRLTVGFSRKPSKFLLPSYCKYVHSKKVIGYYMKFQARRAVRVIDNARFDWPYDSPRPVANGGEKFRNIEFRLRRRDYAYGLGHKTIDQADHNVKQVEREGNATLAMTARTKRSIAVLTTASNWSAATDGDLTANHSSTATALVGGKLTTGTGTNPVIMNAFNTMAQKVTLDTVGSLENEPGAQRVLMGPAEATALAATPEVHDFIRGSPSAYASVTGQLHPNSKFGLPSHLYGYPIDIEASVEDTGEENDTMARAFMWPSGNMVMIYKPGGIEGVYGEQSFSTFTVFYGGDDRGSGTDLVVQEFDDARNQMWEGHVVEETQEVLTCPASGYLLTGIL